MANLRDFLASREAEIREQIRDLRAELVELKKAKAAIDSPSDSTGDEESESREPPRTTIKDMVRTVIGQSPANVGMTASEVLDAIERSFGTRIERTSLSPQLSRLREAGQVVLQDGRWFPSEPKLHQASASSQINSANTVGFAINRAHAEALSAAEHVAASGVAEAVRRANSPLVNRAMIEAAKALGPANAAHTLLRDQSMSASVAKALAGPMSATTQAEVEKARKALLGDSMWHAPSTNRGQGPKTE